MVYVDVICLAIAISRVGDGTIYAATSVCHTNPTSTISSLVQ